MERYDLEDNGTDRYDAFQMVPDESGQWVKYEDAQKRIQSLEDALKILVSDDPGILEIPKVKEAFESINKH